LGALQAHFESWRKAVDRLEDQMQQHPSADNYFEVLQHTTPLLRTLRNTGRTMQDAREACPEDRAILLARDDAGDLERALDLLHHDAKNGMEFMIAKQAEVQAQRAHQLVLAGHRLNVLVALFLPLTAIGSVFGMNLSHGLENWQVPWLFWGMLGSALVIGGLLVSAVVLRLKPGPSWKTQDR
jgi:Mg2+ and Co2+ transporter CorA